MTLPRCATASRKVASLAPSGSTIGSSKRWDQDTTQLHNRTGIQARRSQLVPLDRRFRRLNETAPLGDWGSNRPGLLPHQIRAEAANVGDLGLGK